MTPPRGKILVAAAQKYRDNHHWVPLRLEGKSPECMGAGWLQRTVANSVPNFGDRNNIGILLGKPSGDLVRLDPDFPGILAIQKILFPEPTMIFGRRSSPQSGRLVICKGLASKDFVLPSSLENDKRLPLHDGEPSLMVFQVLSTGKQTVVPPSVHLESGEAIIWQTKAAPRAFESSDLMWRCGVEAFLLAVRQFWPAQGSRNFAAMALARVLLEGLEARYPGEKQRCAIVDALVVATAMAGGDGAASRRGKKRAVATLKKIKAGEKTMGMTRLLELLELPEDVGPVFHEWLGSTVNDADSEPENSFDGVEPVDLWSDNFENLALPLDLLPKVIEDYAITEGKAMGADPAGLAMAALTVCGAAISDDIKLKMKAHSEDWEESARLWTALVALPSGKKTPTISTAARPLRKIDRDWLRQYQFDCRAYADLEKDQRKTTEPPLQKRLCLEDTTIEACQEVLVGSPNGVLLFQDELSGFFGSMDKYSGHHGGAKDRAFWLQSWNGGYYGLNRVGRGVSIIPNLSISLLGGIQPDIVRKIAAESRDDGFLTRMLMINLRPATISTDTPTKPVADAFNHLIGRLVELSRPRASFGNIPVSCVFDSEAQALRAELERQHLELAQRFETINKKLGAAFGKYDGYFGRLCVIWHCIEHADETKLPQIISKTTTERVAEFMRRFLRPHAVSFYCRVLGVADDHDRLAAVAGHILAHKLERVTNRDVQRGDRTMRRLTRRDTEEVFEQLDALGWVSLTSGPRKNSMHWKVNPQVHIHFAERSKAEAARRAATRELIASQVKAARASQEQPKGAP